MAQTYENTVDQICSGLEKITQEILEHLSLRKFQEVSLAAKSYAIMHLELKFLIFGESKNLTEEIKFLHNGYNKDMTGVQSSKNQKPDLSHRTLNPMQREFLLQIRKELIEDSGLFSTKSGQEKEPADNNLKLQLQHLDETGLEYLHEDHRLDMLLYHYYLERYKEFLFENDSYIFDKDNQIRYSDYSATAREIHQRLQTLSTNLTERTENTSIAGLLPVIYEYAKSYRNELNVLKAEVGTEDKFYVGASSEFVKQSTELLSATIKTIDKDLLLIPTQGLITGNTLMDICDSTFGIIDSVVMDENSRSKFILQKRDFENYKDQIAPTSGCYIATMAYGDYNHPQVIRFRNFRDHCLAKSYFGKLFIRFYYKLSPHMVATCKNNNFIVNLSRKILDFIARFL